MGVIGGRTHGEVSQSAFEALLMRYGSWEAVRDAPVGAIERTIRAVTYPEVKARRLIAALQTITRLHGRLTLDNLEVLPVEPALAWLERLPGVGRKAAAATLGFSTLNKRALVIDTHHLRVLHRLGLVSQRSGLRPAHDQIMPILPADWSSTDLDQHHFLMKRLGQTVCLHGVPVCRRCPLADLCPTSPGALGTERLRRPQPS